jgi:Zn-dependent protease with chaperone function
VQAILLIGVLLLAAAAAFVMNWLALIPFRRSVSLHWTERARACYPARVGAASFLWALPATITLASVLWLPDDAPHWMLVLLFSSAGALLGTLPMDREVFPRIGLRALFRASVWTWVTRCLFWFVFLGAAAVMPDEFNFQTLLTCAVVVTLLAIWQAKGWRWFAFKTGIMAPPPERLANIVRDTAARMNVSYKQLILLRTQLAQAFAMPGSRALMFSERLLDILSDDEIATVAAHELGHLTESRLIYLSRHVVRLAVWPWILVKPMIHTFGFWGYYVLVGLSFVIPRLYRWLSQRLEVRADKIAHAQEADPGTYARALTKLYEDNLMPAVNAKRRATHPSLYDRLLAAGVTPDFPRPQPASAVSVAGVLIGIAVVFLALALLARYVGNPIF